jgi:hypothetical protein
MSTISYTGLLQLLIAFDGPSRNIENVDVLFSLETLFLINHTADDIEFWADNENDLVCAWRYEFSGIELDDVYNPVGLASHHESHLLQKAIIKVH